MFEILELFGPIRVIFDAIHTDLKHMVIFWNTYKVIENKDCQYDSDQGRLPVLLSHLFDM